MHNVTNQPITKAHKGIERVPPKQRTKDTPKTKRRTTSTVLGGRRLACEWFLELPVAVVLAVLWVGGGALLGAFVLMAYALLSALVGVLAGAF